MAKLYGLGAAVVIIGALFKILHLPGANEMLILGLTTEAVIFAFSAFEPPHSEPNWSLVFPELAGMETGPYSNAKGGNVSNELDQMLSEANITPELIESLGNGIHRLSENAAQLGDVTDAAAATAEYANNLQNAASSVGELDQSYRIAADSINQEIRNSEQYHESLRIASESAATLADSFQRDLSAAENFSNSIQGAANSAQHLSESYNKSAEILSKSVEAIDFTAVEGQTYNEQLQKISQNLSALNAVYELQLQGSNQAVESTGRLQETLEGFLSKLGESTENTDVFQRQLQELNDNMASLNRVYGNMLSAMNVAR
ncbi:MAG: gliding motility protein GldL [Hyphomicrobiales bacterium]